MKRAIVLLVVAFVLSGAGCSERFQRNWDRLTTPSADYPCGAGHSCGGGTCCDDEWRCVPDGCEWMGVPEDQPTVHYWSASAEGGANKSPPRRPQYPEYGH